MLCLPLLKQKKLVGILYLENNLTPRVFTPDRVAVLQLLASQAAISLENAALYTDLQLQVELLQHLPVSAWTLKPDGTPDFVNQVWLDFAGQTPDFIRSHPEAWMTAVLLTSMLLGSDGFPVVPLTIVAVVVAYVGQLWLTPAPAPTAGERHPPGAAPPTTSAGMPAPRSGEPALERARATGGPEGGPGAAPG